MGKHRRLFTALSIGCSVLVATPSWAAVVEPGYGDLTINQGQGFKSVTSRANANAGDSVMVGPGGSATVVYDDGCKVNVQPGAVTTIAPLSPCASGSNAAELAIPAPAQTTCPNGALPSIGPDGRPHCPDYGLWWVGAGLLAAGLGVGIWQATQTGGSTTPSSP
jgi:hypothetical protein